VKVLTVVVDNTVFHSSVTSSAGTWSVNGPIPSQSGFANPQAGGFSDVVMSSTVNPFTGMWKTHIIRINLM
jgi:hypothetical protein